MSEKLFHIITATDFDAKINGGLSLKHEPVSPIPVLDKVRLAKLASPGRPQNFNVVSPRQVPIRRNLNDPKQCANFLHAIANIELLAIELPLLALLRFGSRDLNFIRTQFAIVAEEAAHFKLLRDRLRDWGCEFGSLAVHHSLWDYAWSCQTEIEHQILIPCYLEAKGLDVTPQFVEKFRALDDAETAQILQTILDDEIGHVRHGLNYIKSKEVELKMSAEGIFTSTLQRFFNDQYKSKVPLNEAARLLAGFTEKQMKFLQWD